MGAYGVKTWLTSDSEHDIQSDMILIRYKQQNSGFWLNTNKGLATTYFAFSLKSFGVGSMIHNFVSSNTCKSDDISFEQPLQNPNPTMDQITKKK